MLNSSYCRVMIMMMMMMMMMSKAGESPVYHQPLRYRVFSVKLLTTFHTNLHELWWRSGLAIERWTCDRGFDSHRGSCITTLGKLFTPRCLCH